MKSATNFFRNFFIATGVIWFFAALSILIFKLSYQEKEIILTLIFPLGWAFIKLFDKQKMNEKTSNVE